MRRPLSLHTFSNNGRVSFVSWPGSTVEPSEPSRDMQSLSKRSKLCRRASSSPGRILIMLPAYWKFSMTWTKGRGLLWTTFCGNEVRVTLRGSHCLSRSCLESFWRSSVRMRNPDKVEACTVIDVNSNTTPDGTTQSCHRLPFIQLACILLNISHTNFHLK